MSMQVFQWQPFTITLSVCAVRVNAPLIRISCDTHAECNLIPGRAISKNSLLQQELLQAECPSCCPNNSIKALQQDKQGIDQQNILYSHIHTDLQALNGNDTTCHCHLHQSHQQLTTPDHLLNQPLAPESVALHTKQQTSFSILLSNSRYLSTISDIHLCTVIIIINMAQLVSEYF